MNDKSKQQKDGARKELSKSRKRKVGKIEQDEQVICTISKLAII